MVLLGIRTKNAKIPSIKISKKSKIIKIWELAVTIFQIVKKIVGKRIISRLLAIGSPWILNILINKKNSSLVIIVLRGHL